MSKKMKVVFIISLILNALLMGLFAGHMFQNHRMRPLSKVYEIRSEIRGNVNKERRTLFVIMGQPNFDKAAFQVQLDRYSDTYCAFNKEFMIELNERLQRLPPEKRVKVLRQITQKRHR
jgi:uncharacterized membrane protein